MAVATYTKSGSKSQTPAALNKKVFAVEVKNHDLLKQAYMAYLSNGRTNSAKTKKRGEIRGGGAKPWRQKGTGRARFGSSRNPIWTGGGVAFGPTGDENYTKKMNTEAKRKALRQALSLAAKEDKVKIIENLAFAGNKTKEALSLLVKMGAEGTCLIVADDKNQPYSQAIRNIGSVQLVQANYLNVYDILNADQIIITKPALEIIDTWLGGKNE
jgi:large subunit ribosomal protein L4